MKFKDEKVEKLDLTNVDDIVRLVIEYLCGETHLCGDEHYKKLFDSDMFRNDRNLLGLLLNGAKEKGLNYEQFNELLLLLNQDRVSKPFFNFFFRENDISSEDLNISLNNLKEGVIKFREFAMLCFGNFRFAYKQLIKKNSPELEKVRERYSKEASTILDKFRNRPSRMLRIDSIKRDETWYTGYITQIKFKKEKAFLEESISSVRTNKSKLLQVKVAYDKIEKAIRAAENKALGNTNIYLTWDYMDVYIATSMRNKWEFQEAHDFINGVFGESMIKKLKLRYFDPTQSKYEDRIDKGLIEGLMLKRVECCIYMAQESDTMGKDSELAATLAQGKPVIAYVPRININEYSKKIKEYPLDYFEKRLLILQAEEIFNDGKCINEVESHVQKFFQKVKDFQKDLEKYRNSKDILEHLSLYEEKEKNFKKECGCFSDICKVLAIAEHYNFERRANMLQNYHPLAIQVDLKSGVANGVLVVRSIEDCANLLYQILTNNMEFTIKHKPEGTLLEENISGCPFRVVTNDEKLTNSFWNFYLT
jgi:hypothetical protein